MIFDGLLQYRKGVLRSGMIKDVVSDNEVRGIVPVKMFCTLVCIKLNKTFDLFF